MLLECLYSILQQTFTDFEVIVGNDYVEEKINADILDIDDSRINFVNHEINLGEIKNMNWLLDNASGKYFTWLADDELSKIFRVFI